jgi:hypothetical protein
MDEVSARSFDDAAEALETRQQLRILGLGVCSLNVASLQVESLRRFVDALHQHTRIQEVGFLLFGPESAQAWRVVESRDVQIVHQLTRLFGDVLPNHPSVNVIHLEGFGSRWVRLFAESFPSDRHQPLEYLGLCGAACEQDHVARMIRRNVFIRALYIGTLTPDHGIANSEGLKLICDSTSHNEHLQGLGLGPALFSHRFRYGPRCSADLLDQALGSGSRLVEIDTNLPVTPEMFSSIVQRLKKNQVLERLVVKPECFVALTGGSFAELENLLLHHNYTLLEVTINRRRWGADSLPRRTVERVNKLQRRVDELLRRNATARAASGLVMSRQFCAGRPSVVPLALERISRFPHLLNRFLRDGDLGELAKRLQQAPSERPVPAPRRREAKWQGRLRPGRPRPSRPSGALLGHVHGAEQGVAAAAPTKAARGGVAAANQREEMPAAL